MSSLQKPQTATPTLNHLLRMPPGSQQPLSQDPHPANVPHSQMPKNIMPFSQPVSTSFGLPSHPNSVTAGNVAVPSPQRPPSQYIPPSPQQQKSGTRSSPCPVTIGAPSGGSGELTSGKLGHPLTNGSIQQMLPGQSPRPSPGTPQSDQSTHPTVAALRHELSVARNSPGGPPASPLNPTISQPPQQQQSSHTRHSPVSPAAPPPSGFAQQPLFSTSGSINVPPYASAQFQNHVGQPYPGPGYPDPQQYYQHHHQLPPNSMGYPPTAAGYHPPYPGSPYATGGPRPSNAGMGSQPFPTTVGYASAGPLHFPGANGLPPQPGSGQYMVQRFENNGRFVGPPQTGVVGPPALLQSQTKPSVSASNGVSETGNAQLPPTAMPRTPSRTRHVKESSLPSTPCTGTQSPGGGSLADECATGGADQSNISSPSWPQTPVAPSPGLAAHRASTTPAANTPRATSRDNAAAAAAAAAANAGPVGTSVLEKLIGNPYTSSPEELQMKRHFYDRLIQFCETRAHPITAHPTVSKNPVDLFRFYHEVKARGGFEKVTKNKHWRDLCLIFGISQSNSAAGQLKRQYDRFLLEYECYFDLGNMDPEPLRKSLESKKKNKKNPPTAMPTPMELPGGPGAAQQWSQQHPSMINGPYPPGQSGAGIPYGHPGMGPPHHPMMHPRMMQPSMSGTGQPQTVPQPGPPQGEMVARDPFDDGSSSSTQQQHHQQYNQYQHQQQQSQFARAASMPGGVPYGSVALQQQQQQQQQQQPQQQQQHLGVPPQQTHFAQQRSLPYPVSQSQVTQPMMQASPSQHQSQQPMPQQMQHPPSVSVANMPANDSNRIQQGPVVNQTHVPPSFSVASGVQNTAVPLVSVPSSGFSGPPSGSYPGTAGFSVPAGGQVQYRGPSPFLQNYPQAQGSSVSTAPTIQNSSVAQYGPTGNVVSDTTSHSAATPPYVHPSISSAPNQPQQPMQQQFVMSQAPVMVSQPAPAAVQWTQMQPQRYSTIQTSGPQQMHPSAVYGAGRPLITRNGEKLTSQGTYYAHPPNSLYQTPQAASSSRETKASAQYGVTPQTRRAASVVSFPAGSVEATQPLSRKRRKIMCRDVGKIEAWRLMMCLKSGLASESSWALNILNILLYDDTSVSYFGLRHLPGLLEVLVEHFRRSLIGIFPDEGFENLERFCSPASSTAEPSLKHKSFSWEGSLKNLAKHGSEDKNSVETLQRRIVQPDLAGVPGHHAKQARNCNNYSMMSRTGRAVKIRHTNRNCPKHCLPSGLKLEHQLKVEDRNCIMTKAHWKAGGGLVTDHLSGKRWEMVMNPLSLPFRKRFRSVSPERPLGISTVKLKKRKRSLDNRETGKASIFFFEEASEEARELLNSSEIRIPTSYPLTDRTEWREAAVNRCLAVSNVLRGLVIIPGNETEIARHSGLLLLLAKLLSLKHEHCKTKSFKQGTEERRLREVSTGQKCDSVLGSEESVESDDESDENWRRECAGILREDAFVMMCHLSAQMDLSLQDEVIVRPLLDSLIHWTMCPSAEALDPLPPTSQLSPLRYSLETLCKLSVLERNVDLMLATPPWSRIEKLLEILGSLLNMAEEVPVREFALVLVHALCVGSAAACVVTSLRTPAIQHLVAFLEQADAMMHQVVSSQGMQALRENPELMGTSVGMLRRAASVLQCLARVAACRRRFHRHQQRLLQFTMSQLMDSRVASIIADTLFELQKPASPKSRFNANFTGSSSTAVGAEVRPPVKQEVKTETASEENDRPDSDQAKPANCESDDGESKPTEDMKLSDSKTDDTAVQLGEETEMVDSSDPQDSAT